MDKALIDQYNARREAAREAWLNAPAPDAENPQPMQQYFGGEKAGPPSPQRNVWWWPSVWSALTEGLNTAVEAGKGGVGDIAAGVAQAGKEAGKNIAAGGYAKQSPEAANASAKAELQGVGQAVLGVMELASALPAGAGAALQKAMKEFTPNLEDSVAIPGGSNSWAGLIRTALMTPQLLLDPKLAHVDPQVLLDTIEEPITYGELLNIGAMVAAGARQGKLVGALKGRAAATEAPITEPGLKALPPASYTEFGERVPRPAPAPIPVPAPACRS